MSNEMEQADATLQDIRDNADRVAWLVSCMVARIEARTAERDEARAERDEARAGRDDVRTERDEARRERDEARRELAERLGECSANRLPYGTFEYKITYVWGKTDNDADVGSARELIEQRNEAIRERDEAIESAVATAAAEYREEMDAAHAAVAKAIRERDDAREELRLAQSCTSVHEQAMHEVFGPERVAGVVSDRELIRRLLRAARDAAVLAGDAADLAGTMPVPNGRGVRCAMVRILETDEQPGYARDRVRSLRGAP